MLASGEHITAVCVSKVGYAVLSRFRVAASLGRPPPRATHNHALPVITLRCCTSTDKSPYANARNITFRRLALVPRLNQIMMRSAGMLPQGLSNRRA